LGNNPYPEKPWDHPDWYDLHDREWTAGSEREPEHYHELLISLPPLDREDHLLDIGAGTGKLSTLIARSYPQLGLLTLVEPNGDKLERARIRVQEILGADRVQTASVRMGKGEVLPLSKPATIAIVGSVLMPVLEDWKETPALALEWLHQTFSEIRKNLVRSGWLYVLENLARFWLPGNSHDENRRLTALELQWEIERAGFQSVECVYRFRDRIILRGCRSS
jgi:SAM-dependent methyltransferase